MEIAVLTLDNDDKPAQKVALKTSKNSKSFVFARKRKEKVDWISNYENLFWFQNA